VRQWLATPPPRAQTPPLTHTEGGGKSPATSRLSQATLALAFAAVYTIGLPPVAAQLEGSNFRKDRVASPPEPTAIQSPAPILFGDFDADADGVPDMIVPLPPDDLDPMPRVEIGSTQEGVINVIHAEQQDDLFGIVTRGAGDVNNDGLHDVIINTHRPDDTVGMTRTFVSVYSAASGALFYKFRGEQEFDSYGTVAAPAGDVNNDGFADILVGAPDGGDNGQGYIHLRSGANGELLRRHEGAAPGRGFGGAIAGLGDIDDDAHPDYAISAPAAFVESNTPDDKIGVVSIYSGHTGEVIRRISGEPDAGFGLAISAADDLDDDGVAELLVGAPFEFVDSNKQGSVHIYSGKSGQHLMTLHGPDAVAFGSPLGGASFDFDADGVGDFIVGAPSLEDQTDFNKVHIVRVSGMSGVILMDITIAEMANGNFGTEAALSRFSQFDLNRDGATNNDDLEIFLSDYGETSSQNGRFSDFNGDDLVNATDLRALLAHFGDHKQISGVRQSPPLNPVPLLFGPGHDTCAGTAAIVGIIVFGYLEQCLDLGFPAICLHPYSTYILGGSALGVGIVCGIDFFY